MPGDNAQARADHVGKGKRPDDCIGNVQIVGNQLRSRIIAEQGHTADEHSHRAGTGNAENQCRHQPAALFGVVRAFRANHAAHVARAETAFVLG
jgi:hypothetical protein